jgi:cytochrome c
MRFGVAIFVMLGMAATASVAYAAGDPKEGEAVFKKSCAVCHSTEEGKNKIGPSLHGVVGRHSASLTNFAYSEAMKKADKTWDEKTLDTYLANPKELVPGTKMVFVGLKKEADRQNVISYLETQK